jgi:hypothetical protein
MAVRGESPHEALVEALTKAIERVRTLDSSENLTLSALATLADVIRECDIDALSRESLLARISTYSADLVRFKEMRGR